MTKYIFTVILLLTISCGKDDSGGATAETGSPSTTSTTTPTSSTSSTSTSTSSSTSSPASLLSTFFLTPCVYDNGYFSQKGLLFDSSAATYLYGYLYYDDAYCTVEALTFYTFGTYSVGSTNSVGTELNMTVQRVTSTPKNSTEATVNNIDVACGFSNWVANVEKNITGLICYGNQVAAAGSTTYQIFKIENDKLYLGDLSSGNANSPTTRPTLMGTTDFVKSAN